MKLQFSLATLLICMSIAGLVGSACMSIPMNATGHASYMAAVFPGDPSLYRVHVRLRHRPPTAEEVLARTILAEPLAIGATIGVLSTIRRLKPRRHTEPPVG
jgi:hypothetical protein